MSQSFLEGLDLLENIYLGGNLIVSYQKGSADGGFILHHILADFVKRYGNESGILLVLTSESVTHWSAISSKLGWNLNTHAAKGALSVLDLTQHMYRTLTRTSSSSCVKDGKQEVGIDLDGLLSDCKEIIARMMSKNVTERNPTETNEFHAPPSSSRKFIVIVDDLTTLQYGLSNSLEASASSTTSSVSGEKATLNFIQNLLNFGENYSRENSCDISVATCVNAAGGLLSATVAHILSTVLFEISPLQTGYSQLFTGYITVKRRTLDANDLEFLVKNYQYKLDERYAKFLPLTKYNF